jgi:hypothetical protein
VSIISRVIIRMSGIMGIRYYSAVYHNAPHAPHMTQTRTPRETHLTYLEASRPRRSDRMAGEVPSMGSQRRLMGGRICVARYHS